MGNVVQMDVIEPYGILLLRVVPNSAYLAAHRAAEGGSSSWHHAHHWGAGSSSAGGDDLRTSRIYVFRLSELDDFLEEEHDPYLPPGMVPGDARGVGSAGGLNLPTWTPRSRADMKVRW